MKHVFLPALNTIAALLVAAILPSMAAAHSSAMEHFKDIYAVFDGIQGDAFWEVCETISRDIDVTLPQSFRAQFGMVPEQHRILGHSWALGDRMPRDVVRVLENTFPGRKKEITLWWAKYEREATDMIMEKTGLPRRQARALGSIVGRIHQLGDRTPDNILVDRVLPTRENMERLIRDMRILFRNSCPELRNRAEQLLREAAGKSTEPERAQAMLEALEKGQFGEMFEASHKERLATKGIRGPSAARVFQASGKVSKDFPIPGAKQLMPEGMVVPAKGANAPEAWGRTRNNFAKHGTVEVRPGLLTADGRLLVAMKTGATSGFLVFAADAGMACYRYHQGDFQEAVFAEKISDAAMKGLVVGAAVGVAVMLGATPTGWCVLAVATATYIVIDSGIRIWREVRDRHYLKLEDLAAFGIPPDSIIKPINSAFDIDMGGLEMGERHLFGLY